MKKSRLSEEQIAYALREVESGRPPADVCRQWGVSEATFYIWKKKYAHLGASELRQLRALEEENLRLKPSPGAVQPSRMVSAIDPRRPGPISERWSMDFVHDALADGRPFRVLTKTGPLPAASNSTSFGQANRWQTLPSDHLDARIKVNMGCHGRSLCMLDDSEVVATVIFFARRPRCLSAAHRWTSCVPPHTPGPTGPGRGDRAPLVRPVF